MRYLREAVATGAARDSLMTTLPILIYCAGLAALREEWAFALRLSGAAASHQEQHGLADDLHRRAVSRGEHGSGARRLWVPTPPDAALAAGRALDADTALREAEAWLDALPLA